MEVETIKWIIGAVLIPCFGIYVTLLTTKKKRSNSTEKPSDDLLPQVIPRTDTQLYSHAKTIYLGGIPVPDVHGRLGSRQVNPDMQDLETKLVVIRTMMDYRMKQSQLEQIVDIAISRGNLNYALEVTEEMMDYRKKELIKSRIIAAM